MKSRNIIMSLLIACFTSGVLVAADGKFSLQNLDNNAIWVWVHNKISSKDSTLNDKKETIKRSEKIQMNIKPKEETVIIIKSSTGHILCRATVNKIIQHETRPNAGNDIHLDWVGGTLQIRPGTFKSNIKFSDIFFEDGPCKL